MKELKMFSSKLGLAISKLGVFIILIVFLLIMIFVILNIKGESFSVIDKIKNAFIFGR